MEHIWVSLCRNNAKSLVLVCSVFKVSTYIRFSRRTGYFKSDHVVMCACAMSRVYSCHVHRLSVKLQTILPRDQPADMSIERTGVPNNGPASETTVCEAEGLLL